MSRRQLFLLWAWAAVAGLFFGRSLVGGEEAVSETASPASTSASASSDVLAYVGEVPILVVELDTALREAGQDPGRASLDERRVVLDQLIEEELFFQSGLESGRLHEHRGVREAVTRRMLDVIFPAAQEPSDEDLRPNYEAAYPDGGGPGLDRVRFRMEERWRRQANADALEAYVAWLRQDTEVKILADDTVLQEVLAGLDGAAQDAGQDGGEVGR